MIHLPLSDAARAVHGTLLGEDRVFEGCSTDSRQIDSGELFIALHGPRFDGHDYLAAAAQRGACAAVVDRQVEHELTQVEVADTHSALGQLAADWRRRFSLPLVAVTGSNGKTTVKEMLQTILSPRGEVLATRGNLNNDIGVPLTLFRLGAEHRYAVIEMGASHAGEISGLCGLALPGIAVITQCAPAHLLGFGDVQAVACAKGEIISALPLNGTAIINHDDEFAGFWTTLAGSREVLGFGLEAGAEVTAEAIRPQDQGNHFRLCLPTGSAETRINLAGHHNIMNALAAAASATALGLGVAEIAAGLEQAQAVSGRLQYLRGRAGSTVIDDSYNANPGSLSAAIEVLSGHHGERWLVLGDMGELGAAAVGLHTQVGRQARAAGIERLFTLGELSRATARAFASGAQHFEDCEALNETLLADLRAGVTVLIKGSRAMHMERCVQALREGGS